MEFDETQQEAIRRCLDTSASNRVVPVTGQAGTGKTTILKNVYDGLKRQGRSVVICAPTGKAAKRVTEATGIEARTIHRLLEYPHPGELDPATGRARITTDPRRDRNNPIEYQDVLADEYAMVNDEVHRNLFAALPRGGTIRVFGDANQLQPIEQSARLKAMPSPFVQLLEKFDGVWLKTIHRQAKDSNIILNGKRINMGIVPRKTDDFQLRITEKPIEVITELVLEGSYEGTHNFGDLHHQIIVPTHKGWVGTVALNTLLQGLLQSEDQECLDIERHTWATTNSIRIYKNDKVIFTVNNYDLGIFNGESGVVREFDDAGQIHIDFGDKVLPIPPVMEVETRRGTAYINPQKDLDLAYAITTHKAQGSEYKHVVYVMNNSRGFNLNRRNLYTGISRARESVILVTDQRALSLSLYRLDVPSPKKNRR